MKVLNYRPIRIALFASLFVGAGLAFLPKLVVDKNVDGVLNAHVSILRSPIEGVVNNSAMQPGQSITIGEQLAIIDNRLLDSSFISELETESQSLTERIQSLSNSQQELDDMRSRLTERIDQYQEFRRDELQNQINSFESTKKSLQRQLELELKTAARLSSLVDKNHASQQQLDDSQHKAQSLQHDIDAMEHDILGLLVNLDAVESMVFLDDGNNDAPYSVQRMDEIEIHQVKNRAQLLETAQRVSEIRRQIDTERIRLDKNQSYSVISNVNGTVWRSYVRDESQVQIGTELAKLIDCDSTFLDVVVNESKFDSIEPGDSVRYRFLNDDEYRTGTVRTVHGVGMIPEDETVAAVIFEPSKFNKKLNRIIIDPDQPICWVGRRVVVLFSKLGQ